MNFRPAGNHTECRGQCSEGRKNGEDRRERRKKKLLNNIILVGILTEEPGAGFSTYKEMGLKVFG